MEISSEVPSMEETKSFENSVMSLRISEPCGVSDGYGCGCWFVAHPVLLAEERGIAKRVELLLRLAHQRVQAGLHVGQLLSDMVHQDLQSQHELAHTHIFSVRTPFSVFARNLVPQRWAMLRYTG